MPEPVNIARCLEHGLHGDRTECFVCGGPVQQIPMIHAMTLVEAIQRTAETQEALNVALVAIGEARGHLTPGMRAGTAEACSVLERAISKVKARLAQAGVA